MTIFSFAPILFNFLFCLLIEEWADIPSIFMLFLNVHKMFNYLIVFYGYLLALGKTDRCSGDRLLKIVKWWGDMDGHEKGIAQWISYEIKIKEIKINTSMTILFYFRYLQEANICTVQRMIQESNIFFAFCLLGFERCSYYVTLMDLEPWTSSVDPGNFDLTEICMFLCRWKFLFCLVL